MKKIIALALAFVMLFALCACGAKTEQPTAEPKAENTAPAAETAAEPETIHLKIWAAEFDQKIQTELCNRFAQQHPEYNWEFEFGVVGEADAEDRYLEDPAAAADIFGYPDDRLSNLVKADALYEVTRNLDVLQATITPGALDAASQNGVLYGYPMTADNGYYLYYDKSVLTEDDVKTLDGLLAAAQAAGKSVQFDVANGWYLASFFLGAGCRLTLDENGEQICDFNNEKGLAAAQAILAMCEHPAFMPGGDTILQGGIGDTICAGVSGPWTASSIKEKLGDNYAAAKLPTFTCNGEQVQMGSFLGCRILGVNTQSAHPVEAMMLAEYLVSEEAQVYRFEQAGYGPSNMVAAASEAVQASPHLAALAAQSQFAICQRVSATYWDPAAALGNELIAKNGTDMQGMLDKLVEQTIAK